MEKVSQRVLHESALECAVAGASQAIAGLRGSGCVVHGAPGCAWAARWARSDLGLVNWTPLIADNLLRHNIIFGGKDSLRHSLRWAATRWKPTLLFLLQGCAGSLISDPVSEIAAEVEKEFNIPVIVLDVPGFKGMVPTGVDLAFAAILNRFAKDKLTKQKNTVNLIAPSLMGSGNWIYDVPEIKWLLEAIGIKVNCILTFNNSIEEIESFNSAEADLYLTYEQLPSVHDYEEKHDLERLGLDLPLPLGAANTEDWYYGIANRFGKREEARNVIMSQAKEYLAPLKTSWNRSWVSTWMGSKRAVVAGPATFAAAFANFLYFDMTTFPAVIVLYGETQESLDRARESLSNLRQYYDPIILENPLAIEIRNALKDSPVEFAFGQTQDKVFFEGECNVPHTNVMGYQTILGAYNFIPYPYLGIKGILYLYQVLGSTIQHAFHEPGKWKGLAYKSRGERTESIAPL